MSTMSRRTPPDTIGMNARQNHQDSEFHIGSALRRASSSPTSPSRVVPDCSPPLSTAAGSSLSGLSAKLSTGGTRLAPATPPAPAASPPVAGVSPEGEAGVGLGVDPPPPVWGV